MASASRPEVGDGVQYHVRAKKGQVGEIVLLPGDPERVPKIAQHFDSPFKVSSHREYNLWSGKLDNVLVSACSTGIGGPATAIAIEELARVGARTFIRVGSCGAITPDLDCGDLAISNSAVKMDGTSMQYADKGYPAIASEEVTQALVEAARRSGKNYMVGPTASFDAFYVGQGRPGFGGYLPARHAGIVNRLRRQRVITMEMEASTIFTVAGVYGFRAGCILTVYANRITDRFATAGEDELCKIAVEAARILIKADKARRRARRK